MGIDFQLHSLSLLDRLVWVYIDSAPARYREGDGQAMLHTRPIVRLAPSDSATRPLGLGSQHTSPARSKPLEFPCGFPGPRLLLFDALIFVPRAQLRFDLARTRSRPWECQSSMTSFIQHGWNDFCTPTPSRLRAWVSITNANRHEIRSISIDKMQAREETNLDELMRCSLSTLPGVEMQYPGIRL
ncbi:hypothetical protein VNO77_22564 [Canavalia gladiata]|uniref:Uncharacterized protein n=1 Tax=Canavalia gladiata TaxID=3824 RepID=A0AAN9QAW9_CANGL